jgi:hypothetical protein
VTTAPSQRRRGSVQSFDAASGLGMVESGDETWPFHCTALADGSRTVSAQNVVDFVLRAAHHGCWEAADIRSAN